MGSADFNEAECTFLKVLNLFKYMYDSNYWIFDLI